MIGLKYVLGIMKCSESSEKYTEYIKEHEEFFRKIPKSAADVINICMNMSKVNNLLEYVRTEDGEECADMCKAVDEMIKNSEANGKKQGREVLLTLMQKMTEAGEENLIPRLSKEPVFLKQMYKKYNLEF